MNRTTRLSAVSLLLLPAIAAAAPNPAGAELSERLVLIARDFANNPVSAPAAAAIQTAALRSLGEDPRVLRLAIDLELKLGHREKALELLGLVRKADPTDQIAMVQTIDLLIAGMQSADEKQKYLTQVSSSTAVAPDVASHACVQLANIFLERGADEDADLALDQALKLNPSNPIALQRVTDRAFLRREPAVKRSAALVNLLKSNPMQPASLSALAEELLRAGALSESQAMYRKALEMNAAIGSPPAVDDVINFIGVLLATGKAAETPTLAAGATQLAPSSPRAWYTRVLAEKQAGDAKSVETAINEARTALTRNLMALHRVVDPNAPEITETTNAVLPDVKADAEALVKEGSKAVPAYASALGDLVWLDVYFAAKAPDPLVLAALQTLTGENSVVVTRAQGFAALAAGQQDEAQVKLSAIADRDLLARVGLLTLRTAKGESKDALRVEAAALLKEMPTDIWAASIRYSLRDLAPIAFKTDDQAEVIAEAAKLPEKWLTFPRASNSFYLMELRPVRVGINVGEPMLMTLRVQNMSEFPLVIGPGGVIDQTAVIDGSTRGTVEQYFPAIGTTRLTGVLVLRPRQSVITPVRVDSSEIAGFFNSLPHVPLTMYTSVVSNPRVGQNNTIIPGPGGFRAQAENVIERQASPMMREDVRAKLAEQLASANPMSRLLAYRAVCGNVQLFRNAKDQNEQLVQLATLGETMVKDALAKETDPAVKAQALQALAGAQRDPKLVEGVLQQMLSSPDWESRLLGALMCLNQPQAKRIESLKPLQADADESVKKVAEILVTIPDPKPQEEAK